MRIAIKNPGIVNELNRILSKDDDSIKYKYVVEGHLEKIKDTWYFVIDEIRRNKREEVIT